MSSLLYALGQLCFDRWRYVFAAWLLAVGVVGLGVVTLADQPRDVYRIPGAESFDALDDLKHRFPEMAGANGQVLVQARKGGKVTNAANRAYIEKVAKRFDDVAQTSVVLSPWNDVIAPTDTVNERGTAAIINVAMDTSFDQIKPSTKDELVALANEVSTKSLTFTAGGGAWGPEPPVLSATEGLGVLVALVILAITFGSLVAAGLPLLTAGAGLAASMGVIYVITRWITVTSTAPLLAVMMGLAVGIDYSLFILARHRDELRRGSEPREAAGVALATAGSAVIFAGVTVTIALLGLFVTGVPFLTVMGVSAALAVVSAVLASLTLLPAFFGVLGTRLAPRNPKVAKSGKKVTKRKRPDFYDAWVRIATRFPLVTVGIIGSGLVFLTLPALDLELTLPDNGTAHHGSTQRTVYDEISKEFGPGYNSQVVITADIVQNTEPFKLIKAIKKEVLKVPNVVSVPIATPNPPDGDTMVMTVTPRTGPADAATAELVHDLRDLRPVISDRYGVDIKVTGMTAASVDVAERLGKAVVPFGLLVIGLSLVLLTIVFRSVAVPIKATLTYLLSVGAAFGSVVLVFQQGVLAEPLNVVYVGPIVCFLPILLMGLLFGLAMDYEVFLVSRMREDFVHGHSAKTAVRTGFVSSAKVVTAAALIMIAVFAAFEPHGDAIVQPIAFALAVGVFVDAFLVRMTLVPAVMTLLGQGAWWMPRSWDKRLPVFDVEGEAVNHQIELAEWPTDTAHLGIHAERVVLLDQQDRPVYGPVSFEVPPGRTAYVRGGDSRARTALVLAVAGRMKISEGKLKVARYVVPQQMMMMRPVIALVMVADEADPAASVRAAVSSKTRILVVDGVDRIDVIEVRAAVLAAVADLARERDLAGLVAVSNETFSFAADSAADTQVIDLDASVLASVF